MKTLLYMMALKGSRVYLFLAGFLLQNCLAQTSFVGTYVSDSSPNSEKLILQADHTFKYFVDRDLCPDTILSGNWANRGRKINLKIVTNSTSNPSYVVETFDPKISGVRFRLTYTNMSSSYVGSLYIDNDTKYISVDSTYSSYPKYPIKKFTISAILAKDFSYKVTNRKSNSFDIKLSADGLMPCDRLAVPTEFLFRDSCLRPSSQKRDVFKLVMK